MFGFPLIWDLCCWRLLYVVSVVRSILKLFQVFRIFRLMHVVQVVSFFRRKLFEVVPRSFRCFEVVVNCFR